MEILSLVHIQEYKYIAFRFDSLLAYPSLLVTHPLSGSGKVDLADLNLLDLTYKSNDFTV